MSAHPADNRFYLSLSRIEANHACYEHRRLWEHIHGDTRVLVTQDMLQDYISRSYKSRLTSNAAYWLLTVMYGKGTISRREFSNGVEGIHVKSCEEQARSVMDALQSRLLRGGPL